MEQCFAETPQIISFKMTNISCMDKVRVKVHSFQKVTLFLRYKVFNTDVLRFCLFEDITDYRDLRRLNLKRFVSIGLFLFFYILAQDKQ